MLKSVLIVLKRSGVIKVATDALKKDSNTAILKSSEATGDLIGNKIAAAIPKWYTVKLNDNDDIIDTESKSAPNKSITPMQTGDAILITFTLHLKKDNKLLTGSD